MPTKKADALPLADWTAWVTVRDTPLTLEGINAILRTLAEKEARIIESRAVRILPPDRQQAPG